MKLHENITEVPQLSLCWCNTDSSCTSEEDFKTPLTKVIYHGPASGILHSCTHESTCLMWIKDIPHSELNSLNPQLLIRTDCGGKHV